MGQSIEQRDNLLHILKRVFESPVNVVYEQLSKYLEDNKDGLNDILGRQFVMLYIYRRRNSLVHEGETFSFEIVALSRVLEKYAAEMIHLFKE